MVLHLDKLHNDLLRRALREDIARIWNIVQQAIQKRKEEGSDQWQDGYPNIQTIENDVERGSAYVMIVNDTIVSYVAIITDGEPAYDNIDGKWLSNGPFTVIHRLAVAQDIPFKGVGTATLMAVETISRSQERYSIKVDTNFDNKAMLHVFQKLGYQYCGEVVLRGNARRKAFEKLLDKV